MVVLYGADAIYLGTPDLSLARELMTDTKQGEMREKSMRINKVG